MENEKHDSAAATRNVNAKSKSASKKTGLFQVIRHSLAAPKPSIKALDALAEVQCPTPEPQPHESVRESGIAGNIYRMDDQDCGGTTR